MNWLIITVMGSLELAAFYAIIKLWRQKRRGWMAKSFWSIVLLLPVLGLLFYGFLSVNPDSQSDHTEDRIGATGGAFLH
jgi:hypothetical protein